MKNESPLATLAAAVLGAAECHCDPACCTTGETLPYFTLARSSKDRQSSSPARGSGSLVLWRHLRAEFAASEATEGRLTWFLWSAGLAAIGCFLVVVL